MNKQIATLMQKEMTRKEFLASLGFGVATIFGFGSLIRILTGKQPDAAQNGSMVSSGYGSSAYGGHK